MSNSEWWEFTKDRDFLVCGPMLYWPVLDDGMSFLLSADKSPDYITECMYNWCEEMEERYG